MSQSAALEKTASLAIHAGRRLLWLLVVFLGITLVSFVVIHLAPGSPMDMETTLNPNVDRQAQERLAEFYGLNKPLYEQYADWLNRLVHLDFGDSMSTDARPVIDKITERLPLTLWFNAVTLFLSLLLSIPIGIIAARRRGGIFDKATTLLVFIGFAMPGFWLALLLVIFFSIELQWLPISGLRSLNYAGLTSWGKAMDLAAHLVLPVFVATFGSLAGWSRFMRSSVLEVLRQDYILTARAKGLSERLVLFRHALANALLPVITLLGLSIPGLISGSVILENIFSLPGLGQLFFSAVMGRDYTLIMGILVLGAVLTLAGNLLADLCYGLADPRIRAGISMPGR
ncbi:ABC transporter permease [Desulfovibrio sp. OttesenSCG-928-A18]|nr:ABC transporter permease [Desulfovibrio sp. OttesenSCG-928-A18]